MSQSHPASASPVTVRRAGKCDLDTIDALEGGAFEADRFSRRSLRRLLASASASVFIAQRESQATGYALVLFREGARVARLYSIAVAAEARGTGVVTALLQAVRDAAARRGCTRLRLEVRASNARARRAYERAGFSRAGMRPHYYPDGEDAVIMERELDTGAEGQSS
ncbi:ribosomal-protein-alanine N-acetyltransferase [Marinicauda algicola]|uniref:Ribosomal-protein-alanine N-acetyltransferase n=1 Tax=Marinicauda algicola TaxID=2029849 RepID=A0A4S2H2Y1_9PROT|nr:ribosomal protein S18-alanine N-acetyltransferase [Marinicauda algicola]TGY89955.1 ribosomal-protein-alanine N-acetyltransferase [Marinicauda algicola]